MKAQPARENEKIVKMKNSNDYQWLFVLYEEVVSEGVWCLRKIKEIRPVNKLKGMINRGVRVKIIIIEVLSITKLFHLYQVVLYTDFLNLCRFGEKLSIKT
jgi:hypothetical protein